MVRDKFKIQFADNPDFNNAQNAVVDYDPARSDFSYVVDKNLSPDMYFRVSRQSTNFNWEIYQQAHTSVGLAQIPASAVAVLSNLAAVISWEAAPAAWLPGATFIIKRINNTSKTDSEIKLTKQDFDKGTYTDKLVAICNDYSYTLQVLPPPGSNFPLQPPTEVEGHVLPVVIGTLSALEVSKGYFPDRTELSWSASGAFDNFIIKRAVYGTSNFVQIALVPGSSVSNYSADDTKGTAGVYYTYQVVGAVKCNDVNVFSNKPLPTLAFVALPEIFTAITSKVAGCRELRSRSASGERCSAEDWSKHLPQWQRSTSYLQLKSRQPPFQIMHLP